MLKDTQILKNVNSDDRVIIKDYINGWIVGKRQTIRHRIKQRRFSAAWFSAYIG